jgi:tetratricopeptide (TPR) repeat protein
VDCTPGLWRSHRDATAPDLPATRPPQRHGDGADELTGPAPDIVTADGANHALHRRPHRGLTALTLARHLGDRRAEGMALRGLGEVERLVGEYSQAREYHAQALTLARHLGDRPGEAEALWGLGHLATDTAERDRACEFWRKALEIYEKLGVPFAETVRAAMCQLDC